MVRVLERHPGALLTGLYLALTSIGIGYDFLYFRRFGVNVLEYAETGDFLVAALRAPMAILYCVLPVVAIWLAAQLRRWVRRVSPRYDAYAARYERKWRARNLSLYWDVMNTLLVVLYAFAFTAYYARAQARVAKSQAARRVTVELAAAAATADASSGRAATSVANLVGTTGKFAVLYYPEQDSTHVVPFDNVLQIVTKARPERRRSPIARLLLGRDSTPPPPAAPAGARDSVVGRP